MWIKNLWTEFSLCNLLSRLTEHFINLIRFYFERLSNELETTSELPVSGRCEVRNSKNQNTDSSIDKTHFTLKQHLTHIEVLARWKWFDIRMNMIAKRAIELMSINSNWRTIVLSVRHIISVAIEQKNEKTTRRVSMFSVPHVK